MIENFMEILRMGGYGGYVWSVYGLAALVLLINLTLALRFKKSALANRRKRQ